MQTSPKLLLESSFRDVFLYKKSPSFNGEIGGRLFQIIFVVFIIIVIIVTVVAFCEKYFNQSFAEHPPRAPRTTNQKGKEDNTS